MTEEKVTEGEIHTAIRKFLQSNKFRLVTKTLSGESLHYRTQLTKPPKFKRPDHVAIKNDAVLVFEDKIEYSDIFGNGQSDIEKLSKFLKNRQTVKEFEELVNQIDSPPIDPKIVGALASLRPRKGEHRLIPTDYVFIGIRISSGNYFVNLDQDGGLPNLFEQNNLKFTL